MPKLEKWNTKRKSVLYTSSAGVQINPIDVVIDNELSMSIPAFSHQLLISSSDSDDFKSGIYNFDELLK